jgi:4'-phosphopantetheinyl transferase EntD
MTATLPAATSEAAERATVPPFAVISGAQVQRVLQGQEKELVELVEAAYRLHGVGDLVNPPSYFLRFPDRPLARIIALPASIGGPARVDGLKWISSFPQNVAAGIPRASAVLILNGAELRASLPWAAGLCGVPILPGLGGAPTWPAGVQGSMTHCAGYAAAAVSHHRRILAIGIDAEPDAPLPDAILDLVATTAEHDHLAAIQPQPDSPNWDRLLFSAKESVYKAWFPLVGEWLDHHDAEILINPHDGTFKAQLSRDGLTVHGRHIRHLHGRWTRQDGILATAIVLASASTGVGVQSTDFG